MTVLRLDEDRAAELRAAPLTYEPFEANDGEPIAGFGSFERTVTLARRDFEAAALELFSWRVQERAGLRVWALETPLRRDTVVLMKLGIGAASLRIPCRVVSVTDQPELQGFTYGTLPGHPEAGEESFMLRRHTDGSIGLTIGAISRPATILARLGGPVSHRLQSIITDRYLRALDAR